MKILARLFLSAAAVAILPVLAVAQGGLEDAKSRLQRDRGKQEAQERRAKELQANAESEAERALLDARVIETIKLLQQGEAHIGLIEARLAERSRQEERLRGSIKEKEVWMLELLASEQRASKDKLPSSIRSPEEAETMARRIVLAAQARPEFKDQALALLEQMKQLVPVMAAVRTESEQLRAAVGRHNEARSRLQDLSDMKWLSANSGRRELSHIRKSAAEVGVATLWLQFLLAEKDANPSRRAEFQSQAFAKAQSAVTSATGTALSQMAARLASSSGPLGNLVRQAQDLSTAWDRAAEKKVAALSLPQASRNQAVIAQLRSEMNSIERRREPINALVSRELPAYAELSNTAALNLSDAQALLRPDEALIFYYVASDRVLVWAVKSESALWQQISVGPSALASLVSKLRHGLVCPSAGLKPECVASQLEFNVDLAHEIYRLLFAPIASTIKDKRHLIIVASGALTSLPFHVLATEHAQPATRRTLDDYRKVAWLGTRQPVTVLPSVTSLRALRQFAKRSRASKPYLGIGNPLLNGPQDDLQWAMHYTRQAEAARSRQECRERSTQHIAAVVRRPIISFNKLFQESKVDLEEIRRWTPLPETADELCEVGRQLGAPDNEILLGSRATEQAVKNLSESGRLADYRVLHFATHAALTGQVQGSVEPGLILTPPSATNDTTSIGSDDGLLTASEIGGLKLDADWVVLSACNTAGANGETAEPLSGMARAFFYAGARTLLVSHWEVDSNAAVFLVTRTFAELKGSSEIGRAEALRRAMRALVEDESQPGAAHPTIWAPFFIVGEGR